MESFPGDGFRPPPPRLGRVKKTLSILKRFNGIGHGTSIMLQISKVSIAFCL